MGDTPSRPDTQQFSVRLDRQNPYLRIHAVNVFVRDQDRSLRFYLDTLGFILHGDVTFQNGFRWVAVSPPDGTAVLSLVAPKRDSKEYKWIGRPTHVVFVTEDLPAKFREWRRRGVRFRITPRLRRVKYERRTLPQSPNGPLKQAREEEPPWGLVFTSFEDIDGNSFSLVGFDEVSQAVEAQRRALAEKLEADRRTAHELEIAKQVQARLFPQTQPTLKSLEYTGLCIQARAVGGDYYDFLDLGQERLGLVIGDISGKGIAAALLMANLQANLRSQCAIAWDHPQRLLRSVNQLFYDNSPDTAYATLFFAEYDDHARRLRYVNCGHLSALILRSDDTLDRLDSTCTVLGLFKEWDFSVGERPLFAGDTLLLYTDGITESFNDRGEEFGEQRVIAALRQHRDLPSPALLRAIVDEVARFSPQEQRDDITLIAAKCKAD